MEEEAASNKGESNTRMSVPRMNRSVSKTILKTRTITEYFGKRMSSSSVPREENSGTE